MSRLFSNLIIRNTTLVLTGAIIVGAGVITLNGNPKTSEPFEKRNTVEVADASSEHIEDDTIDLNTPNEETFVLVNDDVSENQNSIDPIINSTVESKELPKQVETTQVVVSKPLVTYNTVIRKSAINFNVITQNDASVETGKSYVQREGANGEMTTTIKQEFHDGKLVSEVVVKEEVSRNAIDKIIVNGTKPVNSNIIERRDLVMQSFNSQNEYRVSKGLEPLTWNETLYQNALVRSKEITHTWSHTRPNGSTPFTAITVSYRTAGENIALTSGQGSNLGLRFTQMWINSEPHRKSIVKPEFKSAAVAIVEVDGILYATTLFIG